MKPLIAGFPIMLEDLGLKSLNCNSNLGSGFRTGRERPGGPGAPKRMIQTAGRGILYQSSGPIAGDRWNWAESG